MYQLCFYMYVSDIIYTNIFVFKRQILLPFMLLYIVIFYKYRLYLNYL